MHQNCLMQKNLVSTIDTKSNVIVLNIEKHQKESNNDFVTIICNNF